MAAEPTELLRSIDRTLQFIVDEENRTFPLALDIENEENNVKVSINKPIIIISPIDYVINLSSLELSTLTIGYCRGLIVSPLYGVVFEYVFRPKPRIVIDYSNLKEGTPSSNEDDTSDEDEIISFSYQLSRIIQSCLLRALDDKLLFVLFSFV